MSKAKAPPMILQFESYEEMEEWENTPVAPEANMFSLIIPKNKAYKLGNQLLNKTSLLPLNTFEFHWETRMPGYYKKIIQYLIEKGWKPPYDLYKYVQVYPRYHNNKLMILTWYIEEVIYKKIIKLLTIKRHDLFNPNICIKNQNITLKIGRIPLLYESNGTETSRPVVTTLPSGGIVQVRKIHNYLQKRKKKIIATGHLTNEPNEHLFIVKRLAEIPDITDCMLLSAPLEIVTTNNSMNEQKTLNSTKTTTFTKKKTKKRKKRIKKIKKCNWCQINNEQLKKSQTNKSFSTKLKICKCKATYYCSRGHQKKHWNQKHRFDCIANKKK